VIAQFNLACNYRDGKGVAKDMTQAAYWYRKAAEQGDADAQNSLAIRYELGEGVPKDLDQALFWYRKAAAQGSPQATRSLERLKK